MLKRDGATPPARFGACHSKNIKYHLNVVFQFMLEYYSFEVIRVKKYIRELIAFALICMAGGVIGKVSPLGKSVWEFVFENMIWFPVEVVITVLILDKIIAERDEARDRQRFNKITREANPRLIITLKKNLAALVVDESVYDPERNDDEIFIKVLNNPSKYLTDSFFKTMRLFHFINSSDQYYNFQGISYHYCSIMEKALREYQERYIAVMNDDVLEIIAKLQNTLRSAGFLDFPAPNMWTMKSNWKVADGTLAATIHKLFKLTETLSKTFEKISMQN